MYTDGTIINEYDRYAGRGFAEVDTERIQLLTLKQEEKYAHALNVPQGATPVFFRRRQCVLSLQDDTSTQGETIHCIGWTLENQSTYLFIFENGATLLTNDLQAV